MLPNYFTLNNKNSLSGWSGAKQEYNGRGRGIKRSLLYQQEPAGLKAMHDRHERSKNMQTGGVCTVPKL